MFGKRLHVETDGFLAGESVEISPDGIHFSCNVLRRARSCPLENHVLDKMRDAIGLCRFTPRARLNPDTHGHRTQVLHALSENDQAVRQDSAAEISFGFHGSRSKLEHWLALHLRN